MKRRIEIGDAGSLAALTNSGDYHCHSRRVRAEIADVLERFYDRTAAQEGEGRLPYPYSLRARGDSGWRRETNEVVIPATYRAADTLLAWLGGEKIQYRYGEGNPPGEEHEQSNDDLIFCRLNVEQRERFRFVRRIAYVTDGRLPVNDRYTHTHAIARTVKELGELERKIEDLKYTLCDKLCRRLDLIEAVESYYQDKI